MSLVNARGRLRHAVTATGEVTAVDLAPGEKEVTGDLDWAGVVVAVMVVDRRET